MQAHPGAVRLGQFGQLLAQLDHAGLHRPAVVEAGAVLHIHAVGTGVLAHHQQLLHAGLEQRPRLAQHVAHRARDQIAAHAGDDAERAAVVAALADLQVSVVFGGQTHALRGHQINVGIVLRGRRHVFMYGPHHVTVGLRTGDLQDCRVHGADFGFVLAQTAGDDDAAIFIQGFPDGIQRLLYRRLDEAAGVDHHQICALIVRGHVVAFDAQLGEDALGIHQRLGTPQRHKAHPWRALRQRFGGHDRHVINFRHTDSPATVGQNRKRGRIV